MFRAFFLGTTQTKTLTLNSIVMVLSNVVFNYILIFGKFGVPQLGIAGAAIGSSLAELVSLIFFILYTRYRIDIRKYGLDKIPGIRWNILKRMLNVSFWTMVQNFLSLSTWFLLFLYVEHLGERSLAVTNIIRNVSGIMFMVMMAFASTCGSLVSNLIGAGHTDCVPGTIRQHIRIAYAFVLPLAVFFALCPKLILSVYTDMPELQEAAVPSLWLRLSVPRTRQRLFPVRIGNRKHAYCLGPGDDNTGGLYLLHHIHRSLSETGRGICMDIGNCLFRRNSGALLFLHEEREMESEENLN